MDIYLMANRTHQNSGKSMPCSNEATLLHQHLHHH